MADYSSDDFFSAERTVDHLRPRPEFGMIYTKDGNFATDTNAGNKPTNGDRLRSMSDERLAGKLYSVEGSGYLYGPKSYDYWLEWLKEAAE